MSELKKEILENGIHYTLVGDYYFPTCMLVDSPTVVGKWAALYERYLQEEHQSEYTRLIWVNQLIEVLESIQAECVEKLERLIRQMAETEGVTEQLKVADQMMWVQRMNNIRDRAEEIIQSELFNA